MPPSCAQRHVVLERRPQLSRRREHILEPAGHHADDGIEVVIKRDLTADDRAVTVEASPPQPVTDDGYVGAVELIVACLEVAPQGRRDAQRIEVACADALPRETFRLV